MEKRIAVGMQENSHRIEAMAYFSLAAIALGVVHLLCYRYPVAYVRLVTEDQWGEYGTALGFFLAGSLFLLLVRKNGPVSRKFLWALAGIGLIFIAGEEISWGQRFVRKVFHVSIVPDLFLEINAQRELNFHNIGILDDLNRDGLHRITGYLALCWTLLSAMLAVFLPALWNRIEKSGIPILPLRLVPLFLLVPFCFLLETLPKWSEIGELLLGLAVAVWAMDLYFRYGTERRYRGGKTVFLMTSVLAFCCLLVSALTWVFPGNLHKSLNKRAFSSFPAYGMHAQAEQIIQYMYRHPEFLEEETRIKHARMLREKGEHAKAQIVLEEALKEMKEAPAGSTGEYYRRRGIIHFLLGDSRAADKDFNRAVESDRKRMRSATDSDEKARLSWSLAQTMEAKGDRSQALSEAQQAREVAASAALSGAVERWMQGLEKLEEASDHVD